MFLTELANVGADGQGYVYPILVHEGYTSKVCASHLWGNVGSRTVTATDTAPQKAHYVVQSSQWRRKVCYHPDEAGTTTADGEDDEAQHAPRKPPFAFDRDLGAGTSIFMKSTRRMCGLSDLDAFDREYNQKLKDKEAKDGAAAIAAAAASAATAVANASASTAESTSTAATTTSSSDSRSRSSSPPATTRPPTRAAAVEAMAAITSTLKGPSRR